MPDHILQVDDWDSGRQNAMEEYWLISAPGEKTCQQTWEILNNITAKQNNLSVNHKFQIPDLKVGPVIVSCM